MDIRSGIGVGVAACGLLLCTTLQAQLPPRLRNCSPYPTFAEEIRDMWPDVPPLEPPKIAVDRVEIIGNLQLRIKIRNKFIADLKRLTIDWNSNTVQEIENLAKAAWQDHGYFQAKIKVEVTNLGGDEKDHRIAVKIKVEEGKEYRLEEIFIRMPNEEAPAIPEEKLRRLIPLRDGDIFNVAKVRDGLMAMQRAYSELGYIDFTADPITEVEEARQRIVLRLDLNEQKQFRIARLEFVGVQPRVEERLRSQFKIGEPFNSKKYNEFFEKNKRLLPPWASEANVEIQRNTKTGELSMRFDFRKLECPFE
ncbi:MAG: hypothetical protein HY046_10140 [Acidobacteria bacterium]|nr:hypothetical protein [Acidobacteriota bacterium]